MFEQRPSSHPLVHCVWRAAGDQDGSFVDSANECWGIAFTTHADGTRSAELAGPAAEARRIQWYAGDSHWGVELKSHVFWHGLDKLAVLGELRPLPVEGEHVELAGVRFLMLAYENLEELVDDMADHGVLVGDPLVARSLDGDIPPVSARTIQRRFIAATGMRVTGSSR